MIKEYEFYHGLVFTKLVYNGDNMVSLRPYSDNSNASYILNDTIGLYIKYSTKRLSPWRFSFLKLHQDEILKMKNELENVFIILVCGKDGVVTLSFDELKKILDHNHNEIEWVSVSRNPNQEYTLNGSDGGLKRKVGKSDFPRKIFSKKIEDVSI